jgi:hypothetical protein
VIANPPRRPTLAHPASGTPSSVIDRLALAPRQISLSYSRPAVPKTAAKERI